MEYEIHNCDLLQYRKVSSISCANVLSHLVVDHYRFYEKQGFIDERP